MDRQGNIVVDVRHCQHCHETHQDLDAIKRDEPAKDNSTHEAKCPKTGQPIPVWHSGF